MKTKSKFRLFSLIKNKKNRRPFQFWKMSKFDKIPSVLIAAIDQGTSSSRVILFDPRDETRVVAQAQEEFDCIYPREGWAEQDPEVLVDTVKRCLDCVAEQLKSVKASPDSVKAIGITNQRETTLVWDKETGQALHNAVVWLDARTEETVDQLKKDNKGDINAFRDRCGLPISTYFSAVKLKWLLDNVSAVKKAYDKGRLCFGTVDTWLLYNLTSGHPEHGRLVTDVTNASRTMLMNLKKLEWDSKLLRHFGLDPDKLNLPVICSSSEIFGQLDYKGSPFPDCPVAGVLGDQQAALVGQHCLKPGMAKNTYGTGCFMLYNVGEEVVPSTTGMLSTVAYKMGPDAETVYALEGSIAIAGAAVKWLRDNLGLIKKSSEIETLAQEVENSGGVHFVPAALLEAVCFQTREILDAMNEDSKLKLKKLLVDGGMAKNDLMMQIQSDLLDIEVLRPTSVETTALGAAIAAGRAVGEWDLKEAEKDKDCERKFKPSMKSKVRKTMFSDWKKAVKMVLSNEPDK